MFCLPYAGGSAAMYNKWYGVCSGHIRLIPVELAGRGRRINEPLYGSVEETVEDVYNIIKGQVRRDQPYILFGHSMGAYLAYQVAQKIRRNGLPLPFHVFFSGRGAPHSRNISKKIYHTMEMEEFKQEILQLGGTPREFFDHPELVEYLLPVLRNDFRITESVLPSEEIDPLDCDITIFTGKEEDEMEADDIHGWRLHTKSVCHIHYFNGGHFFIIDHTERIVGIINNVCAVLKGRMH